MGMRITKRVHRSALGLLALAMAAGAACADNPRTVRVGYFPNVTHATAIVGFSPQKHTYYKAFPGVVFDNKLFNAGPSAVEALRARAIDMAFIGTGTAINAFGRGRDIVILANAANAGTVLAVRKGSGITNISQLANKAVAVPQIGNTQDVLLRYHLALAGLRPRDRGGKVDILPVQNADILALFQRGQLDAACVPEPWGTRLVKEAGATILLSETQIFNGGVYPVTVLAARKDFADANPAFVRQFVKVTDGITTDIGRNPMAYVPLLVSETKRLSGKSLKEEIIRGAMRRTRFTPRISQHDVTLFAGLVQAAGYQQPGTLVKGILWK